MRLLLTFRPVESLPADAVTKHTVQGLIYSHLWDTEYWRRHDEARFKFFCFSDIFPPEDFRTGEEKSFIISSPDENFIETLYERFNERESLYLGKMKVEVVKLKRFSLRPTGRFITGSPVVVRSMNRERKGFFSFYHEESLEYFITRLTENALKKYRVFTGEDFELDGPIFDRMIPRVRKNGRVDIYVRVRMHGSSFLIPSSTWRLLEKKITPDNRDFYAFLMDTGIGELNSLGFGFLNPLASSPARKYKAKRKMEQRNRKRP
ncbi:CRISPR-associated endoribonuclease Cas6 [Thermococcus indicus]|uniref:CRISPR-associated endoribonuclease Cas6 n=1 Tax=Thermococcus indicus TaxID=2586643 RepID=A0A4Y5SL23_9EURY|nr:CRISPR-associated endoribonuclease Cas6 [Thermococcus indicus]QDA31647.1 CRISPR-associated endoribonuclease Cas6 [Thermococcus indicus]